MQFSAKLIYQIIERETLCNYALFEPKQNVEFYLDEKLTQLPIVEHTAGTCSEAVEHLKTTFSEFIPKGIYVIRLKPKKTSHSSKVRVFRVDSNENAETSQQMANNMPAMPINGLGEIESNISFIEKMEAQVLKKLQGQIELMQIQAKHNIEIMNLQFELNRSRKIASETEDELKNKIKDLEEQIKDLEAEIKDHESHKDDLSDKMSIVLSKSVKNLAKEVPSLRGLFEQKSNNNQTKTEVTL